MRYAPDTHATPSRSRARCRPRLLDGSGLLSVGVGLFCAVAGCSKTPATKASPAGEDRVRYEATTLDGATFSLEARAGAFTLINVWATWCEPCVEEFPLLAGIHRELHGPRFSVLAVSVDSARNSERVNAMVSDWELPFPVVHDPDNRIVTILKVSGYPTSVLIDHRSVEIARREGVLKGATGPFLSQVRAALRAHE